MAADDPALEPGFRLTPAAASGVLALALQDGPAYAAQTVGMDKATLSRLVAARSAMFLERHQRPEVSRLDLVERGTISVSEAWTGKPRAYFRDGDPGMESWLSQPGTSVVVMGAGLAPRCLSWTSASVICLAADVLGGMLSMTLAADARRMADRLDVPARWRQAVASLLTGAALQSVQLPSEIGKALLEPGSSARNFVRLHDRFSRLAHVCSHSEGMIAADAAREACKGEWAGIFASSLGFLETYRPYLYNHPACLSTAPRCEDRHARARSASPALLNVALSFGW